MTFARHEIPTHLGVEDRAFYGLTVRQVLALAVGFAVGYAIWNGLPDLALGPRLGLALVPLALAALFALLRPHRRGLEEWALVAARYAIVPKRRVWQPNDRRADAGSGRRARWQRLEPRPRWTEAAK